MGRNIDDKINTTYGNRKKELSNDIFRRTFELPKTEACFVEF